MFVRITVIEIYVVPPVNKDSEDNRSASSDTLPRSNALKAEFNNHLKEIGGFRNWLESSIAEQMLDDSESTFELVDERGRYLLQGNYDNDFFHVYIDWKEGEQPRVHRYERERLRRRIK